MSAKQWYRVTVFGTGRYVDRVLATSKEEAEAIHAEQGECVEPTALVAVDGIEVEQEASAR